jgi:protoporphyrinogen oxidase
VDNSRTKESIAVVGGGMSGISAALELTQSGRFEVTLFEKGEQLGGLSGAFTWQDVSWDKFYHVILSTDTVMLDFVRGIGLDGELFWQTSRSGFFGDGRLVSMSSALDFIRFPFMTLWQKFRLGMGILYSARIKDPTRLDRIYVREWLTRVFGRRVYENIWDPLLRSKLGDARERTSAAFIWATINRLYGARSAENKQEKMGHVHGGYRAILAAAEKTLKEAGVRILTGQPVEKVLLNNSPDPPISMQNLELKTASGSFSFDKILMTVDCPAVLKMVENPGPHPYWDQLAKVEYLGVICLLLILKRKLSPYYVINLLDRQLPFTGVIEATNIVAPEEVGGRHIVYLPKYLPASDGLNRADDAEVKRLFIAGLKRVFPGFSEGEILHAEVSRERCVQPLQELNYLERTAGIKTPIPNLFMVNTSMIYNSTLNNNAAITLARKAAKVIVEGERHKADGERLKV